MRLPSVSIEGGIGVRKTRWAQSLAIATRIGIWSNRWGWPSNKFKVLYLYIPWARTRAGMYNWKRTRPAPTLFVFRARARSMIWRAAFAALVDPPGLAGSQAFPVRKCIAILLRHVLG